MKKYSISEYAKKLDISNDTVLYRIKNGKISAKQDKKTKRWVITLTDEEERIISIKSHKQNQLENISPNFTETEKLKIELEKTKTQLAEKDKLIKKIEENKTELIKSKDETLNSKNETIESQKKTIKALEVAYTSLELKYQEQQKLLSPSTQETKNPPIEIKTTPIPTHSPSPTKAQPKKQPKSASSTPSSKSSNLNTDLIELNQFLTSQGITDPKTRKKLRSRFNRQLPKNQTLSKQQNGKIYLQKNQDYSALLKT
jgi:hypothetical protein